MSTKVEIELEEATANVLQGMAKGYNRTLREFLPLFLTDIIILGTVHHDYLSRIKGDNNEFDNALKAQMKRLKK